MKLKIVTTADGSHTLYVPELNEHFHSIFGAITESRHIFINNGFFALNAAVNPVNILEVGFGTGLNALLTYYAALVTDKKVHYMAVDPNMLDMSIISELNYPRFIINTDAEKIFRTFHALRCNEKVQVADHFDIHKMDLSLDEICLKKHYFQLVYFDAFAPHIQPGLWTVEIFGKLFESMGRQGILITFSAKGDVKRALYQAGFKTERLPGPSGKREITRAIKP